MSQYSDFIWIRNIDSSCLLNIGDDANSIRGLTAGPDDLIMFLVSHEDNPIALRRELAYFAMNLLYEWAGGVDDDLEPSLFRLAPDFG